MQKFLKKFKNEKGVTLIELVLVIIILGLLVGLAALNLVGTDDDARAAKIASDYDTIATATKVFRIQTGAYPANLAALVPNYLDETPLDPDGDAYVFTNATATITLSNGVTGATKVITKY